jgi:hypothetical protein
MCPGGLYRRVVRLAVGRSRPERGFQDSDGSLSDGWRPFRGPRNGNGERLRPVELGRSPVGGYSALRIPDQGSQTRVGPVTGCRATSTSASRSSTEKGLGTKLAAPSATSRLRSCSTWDT